MQYKDVIFRSFVFSSQVWFWEEKCNGKQLSNKKFNCQWNFQLFCFQLVSFWIEIFLTCQILKQQSNNASGFQFQLIFRSQTLQQIHLSKNLINLHRRNDKIGFFLLSWKAVFSEKKNLVDNFFSKTFWKGVRFGIRLLHPCKFWKKFCK